LSIVAGGEVSGATFASGKGADLAIRAGSLSINGIGSGGRFTGLGVNAETGSTGDAGTLNLNVDQSISITVGGAISARTVGSGKGGSLMIHADSMSIDGSAMPDLFTGIEVTALAG